ncbi:glycosyltransferase family 2 protein [Niallia nealsonii]|uniref:Maturation of the outermost layer of the spore n=1 Tax=Niallia nealsonii TaxID=115979 RepID=A0A2N0YZT5_9BACI|nr:glycosyltransferase family 2 protein [Niallia nealsonii]PKG22771.1 maturation of the outermost layer of the spore [Niallia nealsonii]
MTPLVSVILTSYNKPLTIASAIESVLNQTYSNWELFIMDDNSSKEIVAIIKKYLTDSRISYFNSHVLDSERYKTTRYATLINEAISKSRGDYLTYLTDDNIFLPNRLETMVYYLQHPNIDIVYSNQLVKWVDERTGRQREGVRRVSGQLKNAAGRVDHCSVMHTRTIAEKVFKKYGSYWDDHPDNWNFGDAVFWNRLTEFNSFYPIRKLLDIAWKGDDSFQKLYTYMPKIIPDGTLVRGLSNDVYVIDKQQRRKISPKVFQQLHYDPHKVVRIPDPFLFKYKEGEVIDSQIFKNSKLFPNHKLIKSNENSSLYYMQKNKKHLFRNSKALQDFHFHHQVPVKLANSFLHQIPDGTTIEELNDTTTFLPNGVLYKCENSFYICLNNCLHSIEEVVAKKLKQSITNPVIIQPQLLLHFKQGEPIEFRL